MKMHRVRKVDRISLHRLNVPEDPLVFLVDLEDVHLLFESVVAILDILKRWLAPVDTNVRAVDEPLNKGTVDCRNVEIHVQAADRIPELGLWDCVRSVRYDTFIVACGGLRHSVLCRRLFLRGTFIADDRLDVVRVSIPAACCRYICPQPVVPGLLVCVDDNVVSLANVDRDG